MDSKNVSPLNVLKFAGAVIAFLIGSGFATGQEIMQYFTSYGYYGLFTVAIVFCLLAYAGGNFVTAGYREHFSNPNAVFAYFCGKKIGAFYDLFAVAFVFMSYVIMISGAGATLNQNFGMPRMAGGLIMMLLSACTAVHGLGKIVNIIGSIGPVKILICVLMGLSAIFSNFHGLTVNAAMIAGGRVQLLRAGTNFFTSGISYAGFCVLMLASLLSAMGKQAHSEKEAAAGVITGIAGLSIAIAIFMFGLMAYLGETSKADIPSLILAKHMSPAFGVVFSCLIFAGIYATAVPMLWQVSARFVYEKSAKFKYVVFIIAAAGTITGIALPFRRLVNIIYGINGYVGIILIGAIAVKDLRRMLRSRA